jgi:predicted nucleotidyltransferase
VLRPVPRAELTPVLARLRQVLVERVGERLEQARLFGSYARGDEREDSDVDLVVVVRALTFDEEMWVAEVCGRLSGQTGVPLEPFSISSERFADLRDRERRIALDIEREGIPL